MKSGLSKLPDGLSQLIETLLRLARIEPAQLRELIQNLPDPQAAAQEMVRRGWITQNQFSLLFPDPQRQPTAKETMLVGFGDDESPPDADCDDWSVPLSDEEKKANVPPEVDQVHPDRTEEMLPEPETVEAAPVLSGAASAPQFERDVPVPPVAGGEEARREWTGWANKGLLIWTLILGSFVAGSQFFERKSTIPPVARQESMEAKAGDPAPTGRDEGREMRDEKGLPPAHPLSPIPQPFGQTTAPVAVAKPKSKASLYARVRQVVRENKTEETQRLGMGDIAYQNVPVDGSIMVGMEVTYAPFFNHNIIKSVRPIYQRPDGTRYDGPVCGTPTGVGERVVAKEGYAIGGAAIKSGMGIDGMQLTFMGIGADGLNPKKTYLSKWLGGYGGSDAKMFVNDGRPIIGIAGMQSKNSYSPAFCLCLVTTKAGAIADADDKEELQAQQQNMKRYQDIIPKR